MSGRRSLNWWAISQEQAGWPFIPSRVVLDKNHTQGLEAGQSLRQVCFPYYSRPPFGSRTEAFVNDKVTTTRVPAFPELMSQEPPSCLTLSRIP